MPYIRELTVSLGVIKDTFESAVTWDKFEKFHMAVSAARRYWTKYHPESLTTA